jgi:enterochelin esterase-like enzyme
MFRRLSLPLVLVAACATGADAQPPKGPTLWQIRADAAQRPAGDDLKKLEATVLALFGRTTDLKTGAPPRVEGGLALFAIRAEAKETAHVRIDGERLAMTQIVPGSELFIRFQDFPNCTRHTFAYEVEVASVQSGGQSFRPADRRLTAGPLQIEFYNPHPDSLPNPDAPKGEVKRATWKASKVFPGTERDWAVYVPARCKPGGPPACVMVFQDGIGYLAGDARVPVVFDNLIGRGELPPIVGVFINPGQHADRPRGRTASNRSFEYDTLSDAYARFLLEEMLPEAEKLAGVKLRTDPASRAICGQSSGGICAFTVAWEKPDQFGKVLSGIGSFTNIRGGDVYPGKIRKGPKKNLRVFLQDGSNDLDNNNGNWFLANQQMAGALAFRGYDFTFVTGSGFHSGKHLASIMPDALRWLWRDYRPAGK